MGHVFFETLRRLLHDLYDAKRPIDVVCVWHVVRCIDSLEHDQVKRCLLLMHDTGLGACERGLNTMEAKSIRPGHYLSFLNANDELSCTKRCKLAG